MINKALLALAMGLALAACKEPDEAKPEDSDDTTPGDATDTAASKAQEESNGK